MELLLGCGSSRERRIGIAGRKDWTRLVTLDFVDTHKPDVVHDLDVYPWPFPDNTFQEVHGYELVEHLGRQGDFRAFLAFFSEVWRILKPGGVFAGTCPSWRSMWAWGDPGHTRVVTSGSLAFLSQQEYAAQVGVTPMSDYRPWFAADFNPQVLVEDEVRFVFALHVVKPARKFPLDSIPKGVPKL